jgi:hypothetical protein
LQETFETWHYEETRKMGSGDKGLWSSFVDELLKDKQMASGWPRPNMSEAEKLKYIEDYLWKMKTFCSNMRKYSKMMLSRH